jgi:deoxyribodipyrimidine photo-lyase
MTSLGQWAEDDPRVDVVRDGEFDDGACVLLWIQRAQRAHANPAVNFAVELAREANLPVIAVFCLVPAYPLATLRHYQFMAEGLAELPDAFAARRIGWHLEVGEPDEVIPALAKTYQAAAVVTDLNPLRIGQQWRREVARTLAVPMAIVDSDTVVPSSLFPKEEYAPRTIRPKIQKRLDEFLVRIPDIHAPVSSAVRAGLDPLVTIGTLGIDDAIGPAPDFRGGQRAARTRLRQFVDERLDQYDTERNRADIDAGTGLSPYLHYGQIGPLEVALAVSEADAPPDAKQSLLDELIVQRELAINFALRNDAYDRFAGLPDWARESLARHQDDPRQAIYTRGELEAAATHDRLWNAAMIQMINEGWMPNRLRMYWGKQILLWSVNGETAYRNTVYLNDRYFLDGRDANSYANIAWCIGGRHDRPFGPEREVTGLVRPFGLGAMKRSFNVQAYIDKIDQRWGVPATKDQA